MPIKFLNNVAVDSNVLYVDAENDRVGIGTTNPNRTFTVASNDFTVAEFSRNTAGGGMSIVLQDGDDSEYELINGISYFGVRSNFTDIQFLIARNTGSVGIGTTNPGAKLHVKHSGETLRLDNTSATGNPFMTFYQNGTRRSFIQHNDSGDYLKLASEYGGISFFTGTAGTETQKMVILSGGNVGIGDTNPDAKLTVFRTETSYAINLGDTEDRAGLSVKSSSNFDSKLTISSGASFRQYIQGVNNAGNTGRDIVLNPYGGKVGVGATSPNRTFTVASDNFNIAEFSRNTSGGGAAIILQDGNDGEYELINGVNYFSIRSNFSATQFYINRSSGNISIGNTNNTYKLDVTGTIRATGDVIAFSDIRVKENVTTIENALDKVKKLRGVEYNKIDNPEKSIGVIAQEIENVIPEVVREDDQGMKSVAYGNITAVLIEAIKEQQKQIDELKNQLDAFIK